jgi:DNA-binding response OmpR family regulator
VNTATIPVIVLSAAHEIQSHAAPLDSAAIFATPFDLGHLLDMIARLVGNWGATSRPDRRCNSGSCATV